MLFRDSVPKMSDLSFDASNSNVDTFISANIPSVIKLPVLIPAENTPAEESSPLFKYDCSQHGTITLERLNTLRKQRQLCDVVLTVEGQEIFAHRSVLCCHSRYFMELFLNDEAITNDSTKKQIYYQLDGLEYGAVKELIRFMYHG
ncbi:unnamed protein product, partial [Didymodactylos carnosus]